MDLKDPKECTSAEEIRNEIDKIDMTIIDLFADRHKYIEEIVRFKSDENGVIAKERKDHVIQQRRDWAERKGLNADTFEKIYTLLVENNIQHELKILESKKTSSKYRK